jgi:hypothetical protein
MLRALIARRADDYITRCRHIVRRRFSRRTSNTQTII